jgi:serine/threonine protein phosphatase PrpC
MKPKIPNPIEMHFYPDISKPKNLKKLQASVSQRKIFRSEVPSSEELISLIKSPKVRILNPIQTLKDLHINVSQSARPSPIKIGTNKKKLILPKNLNNIQTSSPLSKSTKRRTQSLDDNILSIRPTINNNCVNRCMFKTRIGSICGKNKKENQDSFIIYPKLGGNLSNYLFAVCDGHGINGHLISRYLKNHFADFVEESLKEFKDNDLSIQLAFQSAIKKCEEGISGKKIDYYFSGSTIVSVVIQGNLIACANVGDSRAVLGKKANDWTFEDLSQDHKPDLPEEASRIIKAGGRVMPYFNSAGLPSGPNRVWLEDEDVPGLAMSRSIGDRLASTVGVISDPQISIKLLSKEDKFIIIASDGLWEFITSAEAVRIVGSLYDLGKSQLACEKLVREAVRKWSENDNTVDDITVIIVFFNDH